VTGFPACWLRYLKKKEILGLEYICPDYRRDYLIRAYCSRILENNIRLFCRSIAWAKAAQSVLFHLRYLKWRGTFRSLSSFRIASGFFGGESPCASTKNGLPAALFGADLRTLFDCATRD
jgi:hypothetical protein